MGDGGTRLVAGSGRLVAIALAGLTLAACATTRSAGPMAGGHGQARGTMRPYEVNGVWYTPREDPGYNKEGLASWYGQQFHHHTTADGEVFDMDVATAAHKTLPLPCIVEVTKLDNGRRIRVRVNDRGPFVGGRILDLSRQGAKDLGFYGQGVARVRVRYVGPAPGAGGSRIETAAYSVPPAARTATPAPPPPPAPLPPTPSPRLSPGPVARVQAGAFAQRDNAERAAARVSADGSAAIEPLDRGDARLWRVLVSGAAGEDAASLQARVAADGFPGAKVIASGAAP